MHVHYSELPALPLARYRHAPDVDNSKKDIPPARSEPVTSSRLFNQKIAATTTTTVFEESEADSDGSESLEVDTKHDAPANAVGGTTTATNKTMWVWPPEGTPQQKQLYGGVTASFHNSEMLMHLEEHLQVWLLRLFSYLFDCMDHLVLLLVVVVCQSEDMFISSDRLETCAKGMGRRGYIFIYSDETQLHSVSRSCQLLWVLTAS